MPKIGFENEAKTLNKSTHIEFEELQMNSSYLTYFQNNPSWSISFF